MRLILIGAGAFVALAVGALFLLGSTGANKGESAYQDGDFKTAFREFLELAGEGDMNAQFRLGNMYQKGQGVTKNQPEAAKWFRQAADRGHGEAQYVLALMHIRGEGVSQDNVRAHFWFSVSSAGGYTKAGAGQRALAKKMSRTQIATAQALAAKWKPKK